MEAVTAQTSRVRIFEALRHRDFRLLWGGQAVSLLGDIAFLTALGWKAFTLAGAATWQPVTRLLDNVWARLVRP